MKNAHSAIISCADYEAVQRTLAIDTRTAPKNGKLHIFSGMLICGYCGSNMVRKTNKRKGKHYIYYRCLFGKSNGCHSPAMIDEDDLVPIVTSMVAERITDIKRLNSCVSEMQIQELLKEERNQQIAVCDMKIHDLHRYKHDLHDARTEDFLSEIEYQEYYDFYDKEIAMLEAELYSLRKGVNFTDVEVRDNLEWTQSYLQATCMKELDRFTVVKTIRDIHVLATKEIMINFTYQTEYEQLLRFSKLGGYINGTEEPQTK